MPSVSLIENMISKLSYPAVLLVIHQSRLPPALPHIRIMTIGGHRRIAGLHILSHVSPWRGWSYHDRRVPSAPTNEPPSSAERPTAAGRTGDLNARVTLREGFKRLAFALLRWALSSWLALPGRAKRCGRQPRPKARIPSPLLCVVPARHIARIFRRPIEPRRSGGVLQETSVHHPGSSRTL